MAKKKQKAGRTDLSKNVVFSFDDAPGARTVLVLGDFNDWNQKGGVMKKNQKGVWGKTISVAPGTYQYKFLVDGDWRIDPGCKETVMNIHGSSNNVIRVKQ